MKKIIVSEHCPPYSNWIATFDGYQWDSDFGGSEPVGTGMTEQEAIDDLMGQYDDE